NPFGSVCSLPQATTKTAAPKQVGTAATAPAPRFKHEIGLPYVVLPCDQPAEVRGRADAPRRLASSARARSLVETIPASPPLETPRPWPPSDWLSSASASTASSPSRRTGTWSSGTRQSRTRRTSHSFRGTFATQRNGNRPTTLPFSTTG